jgi:uncharacterized protein YdhG (YjbR/CyaY superfamily)
MHQAENASMADVAPQEYKEIKEESFRRRIHKEAARVQLAYEAEEGALKAEIEELQDEIFQRYIGDQVIQASQDNQPLMARDRERVQTIKAKIRERENKIQTNTKALNDFQQQVLNILQQAQSSFSKLEIRSPQKRLVLRFTDHFSPYYTCDTEFFEFPLAEKIRYDNPVVGFKAGTWPIGHWGWNLIMKDGTKSNNQQDGRAVERVLE